MAKDKGMTGRQIAQLVGVSPTTVSLVRKGKCGVSDELRQRILQVMEEAGYADLPVTSQENKTILLLIRDDLSHLKQSFYHELISEILKVSGVWEYHIEIKSVNYDDPAHITRMLSQNNKWAAAVVCSEPSEAVICALFQQNIPFVVIDSSSHKTICSTVCVDYKDAAYKMTKYLIAKGHRRIAYLSNAKGTYDHGFTVQTFSGYQQALDENGIATRIDCIRLNVSNEVELEEFLDQLLAMEHRPSAIFCTTDTNAILCIQSLLKRGLVIPGDVSVVGMDDISLSQYITPALTTMHVDRSEMARISIEQVGKLINGGKLKNADLGECRLVERNSVATLSLSSDQKR